MPCYLPVMQFAQSSALREQLYRAYVSRASGLGQKPEWDNSTVMDEILALRAEEASSWAMPTLPNSPSCPKWPTPLLKSSSFCAIWQRVPPYAEKDVADLREFAASELGISEPQAWDWPYISEKLKRSALRL